MLMLGRRETEVVFIRVPPSDKERVIGVCVGKIKGSSVRLGFTCDRDINVARDASDSKNPT